MPRATPPDPSDTQRVTDDRLRELAAALLPDTAAFAQGMLDYLVERIPEAHADPEIEGLTLGSCSSNIEGFLSMIRHGISASATEAPVTALEHARAMAHRGHSVDVMLRFYRLGHAYMFEEMRAAIAERIAGDELLGAFTELDHFAFAYVDAISTQVSAAYVAELERRQNRARAVRDDAVRALLAGDPVDPAAAERALGHVLAAPQIAFICWSPRPDADLQRAAVAVAGALGSHRPLLVADGAQILWGWVVPSASADEPVVALDGAAVHVAIGERRHGPEGFRESHCQAVQARRLAELARLRAPSVTRYPDVAVVDALTRDLDAARDLVSRELGELASGGERHRDERAALLAVLDAQGSLAAAARSLGVHRNTVLQRMRRAEERRGRPAQDGLLELHAALRLVDVLGTEPFEPI